jgi:hypothetical protein
MNNQEFYRGMLSELNKTAYVRPQKKKKSLFRNALLLGGLGGLGAAAGFGFYNRNNINPATSTPPASTPPASTPPAAPVAALINPQTTTHTNANPPSALFDKVDPGMPEFEPAHVNTPGFDKLDRFLGRVGIGGISTSFIPGIVGSVGTKALYGANTASNFMDAINPNTHDKGVAWSQFGANTGSDIMYLGSKALPVARVGGPLLPLLPVMGGQLINDTLKSGTQAAQTHAVYAAGIGTRLLNLVKNLKSKNNATADVALNDAYSLFRSKAGAKYLDELTNPDSSSNGYGNIGYNPMPYFGTKAPIFDSYRALENKAYKLYMQMLKERGLAPGPYPEPPSPPKPVSFAFPGAFTP